MKFFYSLLFAFLCSSITQAAEQIVLPAHYKETFVEYLSLDRVQNPDQFIRLFANETAMQGRDENGGLPSGSVLVAEVYSVHKDAKGTPIKSSLGRRIRKDLLLLAVMEKRDGFAASSTSPFNTGDWKFAAYKPDGSPAPKNLEECRACHAPLGETDFLFSIEHIDPGSITR